MRDELDANRAYIERQNTKGKPGTDKSALVRCLIRLIGIDRKRGKVERWGLEDEEPGLCSKILIMI